MSRRGRGMLTLDDLSSAQRAAVEAQLGRAPAAQPVEVVAEPAEPAGPRFRSRTEARYAEWLDAARWVWSHEPIVLRLPTARGRYTPDFVVHNGVGSRCVEVKARGADGRPRYRQRDDARRLALAAWVLDRLGLPALYVAWPSEIECAWVHERVEVRRG